MGATVQCFGTCSDLLGRLLCHNIAYCIGGNRASCSECKTSQCPAPTWPLSVMTSRYSNLLETETEPGCRKPLKKM